MQELDEFDFNAGLGRTRGTSKYPVDQLLNGGIWRITEDDYPDVQLKSVEGSVRQAATTRKLKLRTRFLENGTVLILQAYSGKKKK